MLDLGTAVSQPAADGLSSGSLPLLSLNDLRLEDTSLDWDVEGLILRGERVLICGEPGTMKSWLLQDLAMALITGTPWLGHFRVPTPRQVLYLDEEMHEPTWRRRLLSLSVDRVPGTHHPARHRFRLLAHPGLRFRDGVLEALLEAVQRQGFDPDVLIVDSVRRVIAGSELEPADVAAFWRCVEGARRAGKTVILTHHLRKPRVAPTDRPARASAAPPTSWGAPMWPSCSTASPARRPSPSSA
jgi:RecA-family ATPase